MFSPPSASETVAQSLFAVCFLLLSAPYYHLFISFPSYQRIHSQSTVARIVRDPSIVSPSQLAGVFISGGHNKHGTGSSCTLQK